MTKDNDNHPTTREIREIRRRIRDMVGNSGPVLGSSDIEEIVSLSVCAVLADYTTDCDWYVDLSTFARDIR